MHVMCMCVMCMACVVCVSSVWHVCACACVCVHVCALGGGRMTGRVLGAVPVFFREVPLRDPPRPQPFQPQLHDHDHCAQRAPRLGSVSPKAGLLS